MDLANHHVGRAKFLEVKDVDLQQLPHFRKPGVDIESILQRHAQSNVLRLLSGRETTPIILPWQLLVSLHKHAAR